MISDNWGETLAALCVWREARGESMDSKLGVAWVLRNRRDSGRWGDLSQVVLAPRQFSSFNRTDPNVSKFPLIGEQAWEDSCTAIDRVFWGEVPDPTGGAMWYVSGKDLPPWTRMLKPTAAIGPFVFFGLGLKAIEGKSDQSKT